MNKVRLKQRIAYAFDSLMSKGLLALVALLSVVTILFVLAVTLFVVLFGLYPTGDRPDFLEVLWLGILRTLDAGTMGADQGFGFRAAMFVVTIGGVVLVASLIGIISNAFSARVEQLRKGRSTVLESDHTLILGWNSKIFQIIHEISVANESRKNPSIVILANQDKVEMEDAIRAAVKHHGKTRIIVRSGDPMNLADIEITSHQTARSIVILAPENSDDPDATSIKVALALVNNEKRREEPYHVIGEIKDRKNMEAARLVGGAEVHWITGEDLISRLIVQTCRQSGLSAVFTELLDFEGSELYIHHEPKLIGKTYGEAILSFSQGVVTGLVCDEAVELNPDPGRVVESKHSILVVAEDDSKIEYAARASVDDSNFAPVMHEVHAPERTLILGGGIGLESILRELSFYMPDGSEVTVVGDLERQTEPVLENVKVQFLIADSTSKHVLEKLDVTEYNHIVVLADRQKFSVQKADARTLLTLLHLRELSKDHASSLNIVSEMLDDNNRALAETTRADDFIVSDKLVSLMVAQLEENDHLVEVFDALFSSEGSELRLHPAEWYVRLGVPVDFNTVVAAAARNSESAIGFSLAHLKGGDSVKLNPVRSQAITYALGDKIVVLTNE